jgi:CBS domain-containing protein
MDKPATPGPAAADSAAAEHDARAIAAALAAHRVLGQLGDDTRAMLQSRLVPQRFAAGAVVASGVDLAARLALLLVGRIAIADARAELLLHAPEWFGAGVTPVVALMRCSARAVDDCLIAFLDAAAVDALRRSLPLLALTLAPFDPDPAAASDPHLNLIRMPVRSLVKREPVSTAPMTPVRAAAELMREQRVSSVLLVEQGRLFGLVTDRDLRNRALADGIDPAVPVIDIATVAPLTIPVDAPAFDALLLMARHNIHHLPVMDGERAVGMITATDVTEQHSTSAVFLAGDIHEQTTLEGLVDCAARVKTLQKNLATAGSSAWATGHIVTAVTDALTTRLLHLGEARLGPPPVDYAWVAAGSQGRNEQTAKSDQDNCLILDDVYDETRHGAYFADLAGFVCDGLHACGYVHCPGASTSTNGSIPRSRWR